MARLEFRNDLIQKFGLSVYLGVLHIVPGLRALEGGVAAAFEGEDLTTIRVLTNARKPV